MDIALEWRISSIGPNSGNITHSVSASDMGTDGGPGAEEAEPLNSRRGDKFIRRSVRCRSQKESVIIMSSNQRDCPS